MQSTTCARNTDAQVNVHTPNTSLMKEGIASSMLQAIPSPICIGWIRWWVASNHSH